MTTYSVSPYKLALGCWTQRHLIITLAKREITGRYRGSAIGMLWSLITPALMLTVYTFVFSVVFKARWAEGSDSKTEFALMLFAGLIIFNLFSECFNKAASIIPGNPNFVKKVVFPLEILPIVNLSVALFHFAINLSVWIAAYVLLYGTLKPSIILLPICILPLLLFTLGTTWLLASLGVYLKDINQLLGITTTVLMFLSPIFYPTTALPPNFQKIMQLNPLTLPIEQTRHILFSGELSLNTEFLVYWLASLLCAFLGYAWFQKTRRGFADAL